MTLKYSRTVLHFLCFVIRCMIISGNAQPQRKTKRNIFKGTKNGLSIEIRCLRVIILFHIDSIISAISDVHRATSYIQKMPTIIALNLGLLLDQLFYNGTCFFLSLKIFSQFCLDERNWFHCTSNKKKKLL